MLICIDAGHYIGTPGKRCLKDIDPGETREWTLNSRVADKLEAILAGYDCRTMRVDDVTGRRDVTLSQRVAAANRAKADVYLSIHHNAGINGGSGGGIVAYVSPSHQKQSEVVRDAVYRHTVAATGLRGNRAQPLAEQSLYVCNYTTMPATLIELGFMDSTTDTPVILTEQFADQAAAGLAAALVEVYDLQAKGGGQVLMTAVPAEDLTVELVDRPKSECGDNCANAGYFANYSEAGEPFTLPVGHLVADYKAAGKWTRHYCQERGRFQWDRFTFDAGRWVYANPMYGKAISTLLISGGKARVEEIRTAPEGTDYAVSGIPVLRAGKACTTAPRGRAGIPLRCGPPGTRWWASRETAWCTSWAGSPGPPTCWTVARPPGCSGGWAFPMCSSWTAAGATTRAGAGRSPRPRKTGGSTACCAGL